MALYDPLVPTGFVDLDTDYANLQNNFQELDNVYGIDHVKYSVITNTGFHNKVTTPDQVTAPVTVTNPVFYALQLNTAVGLLQFSRGANNAPPTPLTKLYSSDTGFSITSAMDVSVLDLTGFSLAIIRANVVGTYNTIGSAPGLNEAEVYWDGTTLLVQNINNTFNRIFWVDVGNVLTLRWTGAGGATNVFWALEIVRIKV